MCVRVCVCVCVRACVLACMGVCVRVRASARAEEVRSDGDLVLCFVTGYVFQFGETADTRVHCHVCSFGNAHFLKTFRKNHTSVPQPGN